MSDLKFNCPHCQQRLGLPEAAFGRTIPCPCCKGHIRLPELQKPQAEAPEPTPPAALRVIGVGLKQQRDDLKFACPTCAVHIVIAERAAGKKITCQRCGTRILVPGGPPPPAAQPAPAPMPERPEPHQIPELIEKLRRGDEQAGRALIMTGESVIPALIEGFKEHALDEPDTNRGADYVANLLVKCGAASVQHLIAKLGKSRHAYLTLGRIGSEEAVHALAAELSSCNWRRVEVACEALGLAASPALQTVVDPLQKLLKTTRSGEVYSAAAAALAAIQQRYPKSLDTRALSLQEKVAQSKITPLKVMAAR